MTRYLLIILLLAGTAMGATVTISSLPYTWDQSSHSADEYDTLIIAGTKLISLDSGITLTGGTAYPPRKVRILLQSDTIIYGTDDGERRWGIRIKGGSTTWMPRYIEIIGGHIIHSPSSNTDTTIGKTCTGIRLSGNDMLVRGCTVTAAGYQGQCISMSSYNQRITGSYLTSNVMKYFSRCAMYADLIASDQPQFIATYAADSGLSYNGQIDSCTFVNAPHIAIKVNSSSTYGSVWKLFDNNITIDQRNTLYLTGSGTCYSSANAYGIDYTYPYSDGTYNSVIYGNIIRSGTTYGGGRGIYVSSSKSYNNAYTEIYNNDVQVHEGAVVEYSAASFPNQAMIIRGTTPNHLSIHDNILYSITDNDEGTLHTGPTGYGIRYTMEQTTQLGLDTVKNKIYNNKIKATGGTGTTCCAVMNEGWNTAYYIDSSSRWYNNKYESDNNIVRWGFGNSGACGWRSSLDTFSFTGTLHDTNTFYLGYLTNTWVCTSNVITDGIYLNNASPTSVEYSGGSGAKNVRVKRTVPVYINNANNTPLQDIIVTATDAYGLLQFTDTTSALGYAYLPVSYYFDAHTTTDSNYNNLIVKAKNNADSTMDTITVAWNTGTTTLTLPSITYSDEALFSYTTELDASLGIPYIKGYIPVNDTNTWYILLSNNLHRSTNAGVTWPDSVHFWGAGDAGYHSSIDGAGDSVAISSNTNQMIIFNGITPRTTVTVPNQAASYIYNYVVIDTAGADKIFLLNRQTSPADSNMQADYTTDGGANWTKTAPLNNPSACRIGGFPFIGGHPTALEVSGGTTGFGANYALWNGSAWVTYNDSQICPNTYFDASLNNRAFTFNGYIDGSDTLMFFSWSGLSTYNFRCRWKRFQGGTGAWHDDTLSTSGYTNNANWHCISSIVNNKFCVFYRKSSSVSDADYRLYMRYFISGADTFSTERMISDIPYVRFPNSCQDAHCRRGFVFFENSNTNQFYTITITDISAIVNPPVASTAKRIKGIRK